MAHPHIPPHAEAISRMTHQQTFGTNIFKEHDELQLEEHDGVNRGTASACIGLLHKLPDKREVECPVEMPIEVIRRD